MTRSDHADRCSPARGASRECGFTLAELVIVMAVVGILAAVALPSYQSSIRRSARADAQSFLADVANRQQQFLLDKRRYASSVSMLNMAAPSSMSGRFAAPITIDAPDVAPPSYTLTATAIGDQAYDKCATLTLDSAGNRGPSGCW